MAAGLGGREGVSTSRTSRVPPKSYVLEMLPYPSGTLHVGHMLVYTIGDVVTRFRARNGIAGAPPAGVRLVRPARRERRDQPRASTRARARSGTSSTSRARCAEPGGRTTGRGR